MKPAVIIGNIKELNFSKGVEMDIIVNEILKQLRKANGVTQENLAEHLGISVQAVSKWECGLSFPDIEFWTKLSKYFGVTIDYLLTGKNPQMVPDIIPDDNVLRIVQYQGRTLITQDVYDPKVKIMLSIDSYSMVQQIEIWGSANIEGNINGDVIVKDHVNCGNVYGNMVTGGHINCGNVDGDILAGSHINCGNIDGDVNAAGGGINCSDIKGNVDSCIGDIHCIDVKGNVSCEGSIYFEKSDK